MTERGLREARCNRTLAWAKEVNEERVKAEYSDDTWTAIIAGLEKRDEEAQAMNVGWDKNWRTVRYRRESEWMEVERKRKERNRKLGIIGW
jgi:hypothetical protein